MAKFYCKNCGMEFSSVKSLTSSSCSRSTMGSYKGKHELYEGREKKAYTCKYCGKSFPTIKSLTNDNCYRHPSGAYKGKHSPAL